MFKFNEKLNVPFLETFYKGNVSYATDLFELYVTRAMGTVAHFEQLIRKESSAEIIHYAHTLRKFFSIVGLNHIEELIIAFEMTGRKANRDNPREAREIYRTAFLYLFAAFKNEVYNTFSLIEVEYIRLKTHLLTYQ